MGTTALPEKDHVYEQIVAKTGTRARELAAELADATRQPYVPPPSRIIDGMLPRPKRKVRR